MKPPRLESNSSLYPNNLPLPLNRFIGRERELEQLRALVWSTRLLTLTGPGGCGKTRLAIRLAGQLLDAFRDGVWFVDLAPLPATGPLPQAVAAIFSLHEPAERSFSAALIDYLRPRELLLVLDNCEHVLSASAELATALLSHSPNLFILATSREALNIDGEIAWQTPPLSLLDVDQAGPSVDAALLATSEAARLFLDRAAAVQPAFGATDQNAPVIAQICGQLDGLPLAIELAAARVRALPIEEIAARLDDRFELLKLGRRTAHARHQTLRAMIDWSYGLLSSPEKKLFRRLAVFIGGWTSAAAKAICSDADDALQEDGEPVETQDALARLVDKSLVNADTSGSEARYHFLETIREYAREKLERSEEAARVRDRHLQYFCDWAETTEATLTREGQLLWLERYNAEHDNLRAAMEWSRVSAGKIDWGLRLAGSLEWFWQVHGFYSEGRELLAGLLARSRADERSKARAKALFVAAGLAFMQSDYSATCTLAEESLSIYQDLGSAGRSGLAYTLIRLGDTWRELGNYAQSFTMLDEGLRLMRELDDPYGLVTALWQMGYFFISKGDYPQAERYFLEALPLSRHVIDRSVTAVILSGLSELAVRRGDFARAAELEEEGLALRKQIGEKWGIAVSVANFGWIALQQGDFAKAESLLLESFALRCEIEDRGGMAWCLEKLAKINLLHGKKKPRTPSLPHFHRAARLFGAAASLRAPVGSVIDRADQAEYACDLEALRSALGQETFSQLWTAGEATSTEEIIAELLAETAKENQQLEKEKFVGLTAREREVAALIAAGKPNREIAQALTIEVKTVEAHVTHIFNKLSFDSRVQIAVWAVEKGLAHPREA